MVAAEKIRFALQNAESMEETQLLVKTIVLHCDVRISKFDGP